MLKVGLTGGIGSGKTTVSKIFKVLGIAVFDADAEAKNIVTNNTCVRQQIIDAFGINSYQNNIFNRKYIANIVFNNATALQQLNNITHPATIQAFDNWALQQNGNYIIKEAALLFEANTYKDLDFIIGVFAPAETRIKNVMQRDSLTEQEVLKRMKNQMPDEEKLKLCNAIIYNNKQQSLIEQVLQIHNKLLQTTV